MNLYNNRISRRINKYVREKIVAPNKSSKLKNKNISIICNNCTGGFISHDLNLTFQSPTINMFFRGLDFFDFVENFDFYIKQSLTQIENPRILPDAYDYPVAILKGEGKLRDLELHFLHYDNFKNANAKWLSRSGRINFDNLYFIWSFVGMEKDEELYRRAQKLPVKNKVIFVNHEVDNLEYPDFFYIKGFENNVGLGQLAEFTDLKGTRYYDQFDYISWFNKKKN